MNVDSKKSFESATKAISDTSIHYFYFKILKLTFIISFWVIYTPLCIIHTLADENNKHYESSPLSSIVANARRVFETQTWYLYRQNLFKMDILHHSAFKVSRPGRWKIYFGLANQDLNTERHIWHSWRHCLNRIVCQAVFAFFLLFLFLCPACSTDY